jgi:hypothetical protein
VRADGALDIRADLRSGVAEKILSGQAFVDRRIDEPGDPAGGDRDAADAARSVAEPRPEGGEFRRGNHQIRAQAFFHEVLERLQNGQTAVDLRFEGSALDHQDFGDLRSFFGDQPLLEPEPDPPACRQQECQREQGGDHGSAEGSVLQR